VSDADVVELVHVIRDSADMLTSAYADHGIGATTIQFDVPRMAKT
jgi:hypothetical protein